MTARTYEFTFSTKGFGDPHDITEGVAQCVADSGVETGTATVFVPGSTAGVTTIEFEPGVLSDLRAALERMAPEGARYAHDSRWGDGNGFSHVRAALLGPSLSVPFTGKRLLLGTWQQIVLFDFDNRPRKRRVVVQVVG
ncbi:MAG: YjbQ family protein [Candidatus Tectomicrobia bacterium]|nr:YjbQ family protein [Candidatus Tectomicrobia bacterium]